MEIQYLLHNRSVKMMSSELENSKDNLYLQQNKTEKDVNFFTTIKKDAALIIIRNQLLSQNLCNDQNILQKSFDQSLPYIHNNSEYESKQIDTRVKMYQDHCDDEFIQDPHHVLEIQIKAIAQELLDSVSEQMVSYKNQCNFISNTSSFASFQSSGEKQPSEGDNADKDLIIKNNKIIKIECLQHLNYQFLDFNTNNLSLQTLFCDIPFNLNNFIEEAEGKLTTLRLCSYNEFKKVVDVQISRNGTMMDCDLTSYSNCLQNADFIISLLESKGNSTLYKLAILLKTFNNRIQKLLPEAQFVVQNYDLTFLIQRRLVSLEEKKRILLIKDPNDSFYFKTYTIDWDDHCSPKVSNYGFSKGYIETIGLTLQEYKQYILRKGFIECFNQNDRLRQMLLAYLTVPWDLKQQPIIIKTKLNLLTYDNIEIKQVDVTVECYNLSHIFDSNHKFVSDFCEMMMIINIRLDDFQKIRLKNLRKNRCKRPVDDKDNDEMDFYYSRESQSFLERYYKDIYGDKNCRRKNLKRCEFVDIIS